MRMYITIVYRTNLSLSQYVYLSAVCAYLESVRALYGQSRARGGGGGLSARCEYRAKHVRYGGGGVCRAVSAHSAVIVKKGRGKAKERKDNKE
jgi:hypothetical protein